MPRRVRVTIPSEQLHAGEAVIVHGPDSSGAVDTAAGERMARQIPCGAFDGEHFVPGERPNGPAGLGPAGEERLAASVLSEPLAFGVKEFAVSVVDRYTGQQTLGATVSCFVNSSPLPATGLRPVEDPIAGALRFTFTKSEDFS